MSEREADEALRGLYAAQWVPMVRLATMLLGDQSRADEPALRQARHLDLLAALDGLPARQREVLTLRYWGELTGAEIADALGINPGPVKTHAHRALTALAARREELS